MEDKLDELVSVMYKVLSELQSIDRNLVDIQGLGASSLTDICEALNDIKGVGLYNSLSDVYDKIDSLESTIESGDNY